MEERTQRSQEILSLRHDVGAIRRVLLTEAALRILTIRESTWLNVTPGAAWRRILSLEEWPSWNQGIADARWLGRRGWREGNRFRLVPHGPRFSFLSGGMVSRVESDREVRWVGRLLTLRVEFAISLRTEGVGTRVDFGTTARGLAVRIVGQDTVVRSLSKFQRRFLAELRESGERVGV